MSKTTSQLIAEIESGNVPWAMRYEAKFTPSPEAINNCIAAAKPAYMNRTTAETICRTSWGRYQIMGENIYTVCDWRGNILEFLGDDEVQEECFQRFVEKRGINFTAYELQSDPAKRSLFARRYNGSSAYAQKIIAAMEA